MRLWGIDAPELGQACERRKTGERWACGEAAHTALAELVNGRHVRCEPKERDRYGCLIAACSVGGRDLGGAPTEGGSVFPFERYTHHYSADVAAARAAGSGI